MVGALNSYDQQLQDHTEQSSVASHERIEALRNAAQDYLAKLERKLTAIHEQLMNNSDQIRPKLDAYIHEAFKPPYDAQADGYAIYQAKYAIGCVPGSVRMLAGDHNPSFRRSGNEHAMLGYFRTAAHQFGLSVPGKGISLVDATRALSMINLPFSYDRKAGSTLQEELAVLDRQDDQKRSLGFIAGIGRPGVAGRVRPLATSDGRPFDQNHPLHAIILNGVESDGGGEYVKVRDGRQSYLCPLYIYNLVRVGDSVVPGDRRAEPS